MKKVKINFLDKNNDEIHYLNYVFEKTYKTNKNSNFLKNKNEKELITFFCIFGMLNNDLISQVNNQCFSEFNKKFDKKYTIQNNKKFKKYIFELLNNKKYLDFFDKNLKFWGVSKKEFDKVENDVLYTQNYFNNFDRYKSFGAYSLNVNYQIIRKNIIVFYAKNDFFDFNLDNEEVYKMKIFSVFAHEYSHCIQYLDNGYLRKKIFSVLKMEKYSKILKKFEKNSVYSDNLYTLVLEILNYSISDSLFSAFNLYYFGKNKGVHPDVNQKINDLKYVKWALKQKEHDSVDLLIINQSVKHCYKDVYKYFEKGKKVDKKLVKKVIDLILLEEKYINKF